LARSSEWRSIKGEKAIENDQDAFNWSFKRCVIGEGEPAYLLGHSTLKLKAAEYAMSIKGMMHDHHFRPAILMHSFKDAVTRRIWFVMIPGLSQA